MVNKLESNIVELLGPRKLVIKKETIDLSRLKNTELAARTVYSALSAGTEVAAYKGEPPLKPGKVYPRVVGYCNVAEVIACGSLVKNYKSGDRILTFQSHRSSFVCNEESIILKIPARAHLKEAAVTYLFDLGYHALLRGALKPGYTVAVVGLGTLGLTTVAMANYFGSSVYGFSNIPKNRILASKFGAIKVFSKQSQTAIPLIEKETHETGIDLVVDTSNQWNDWRLSLDLVRIGGTISILGFPGRGQSLPTFNPLDSHFLYVKQLKLVACGYTPDYILSPQDIRFTIKRSCSFILDLIMHNKLPAKEIITGVYNWDEIESVYKAIAERKTQLLSCILKW